MIGEVFYCLCEKSKVWGWVLVLCFWFSPCCTSISRITSPTSKPIRRHHLPTMRGLSSHRLWIKNAAKLATRRWWTAFIHYICTKHFFSCKKTTNILYKVGSKHYDYTKTKRISTEYGVLHNSGLGEGVRHRSKHPNWLGQARRHRSPDTYKTTQPHLQEAVLQQGRFRAIAGPNQRKEN